MTLKTPKQTSDIAPGTQNRIRKRAWETVAQGSKEASVTGIEAGMTTNISDGNGHDLQANHQWRLSCLASHSNVVILGLVCTDLKNYI